MNTLKSIFRIVIVTALGLPAVYGSESNTNDLPAPAVWTTTTTPQFLSGSYTNSPTRDSITSIGLSADIQYLERWGVSLGITSTDLQMKSTNPAVAANNIKQTSNLLSGRLLLSSDRLPGNLTVQTDLLTSNNNDATNETNQVLAISPQISFLDYNRTYYLNLGYATSHYGASAIGNGALTVTQWTPTFGFKLSPSPDWLFLRAYHIVYSNPVRARNLNSADALEIKVTIYPTSSDWGLEQMQISSLYGQRIYTVDSGSIYNLADIQRGSTAIALQWPLWPDAHLTLQGGYDHYDTGVNVQYTGNYIYLGITNPW